MPNKGDTAWMLTSTALVLLMSVPALALFYGGLVRKKNMLSVLIQVFVVFSLITVLWCVYGYSLAFTGRQRLHRRIRAACSSTAPSTPPTGTFSLGATFSKGTPMYELVFVAFQATFAAITVCLILGSIVERVKFSAVLIFSVIWFTFSYLPVAHMVWFWQGPDAYTAADVVDAMNAKAGLLWQWGALDFAGGTVVHINAGVAGLVGAVLLGKRIGYRPRGDAAAQPDDDDDRRLTAVVRLVRLQRRLGTRSQRLRCAGVHEHLPRHGLRGAVLDVRRVGVQGQALAAGRRLGRGRRPGRDHARRRQRRHPGRVRDRPARRRDLPVGRHRPQALIRADDSLDVFGVHAVGGITGALLTGVFNAPSLGGPGFYNNWFEMKPGYGAILDQLLIQAKAVGVTVVWTAVSAFIAFKIADLIVGLRVAEEEEREGLDTTSHGESAYHD